MLTAFISRFDIYLDFVRDILLSRLGRNQIPYVGVHMKLVTCFLFVTPVAGLIFETKNRAIFLERFFGRGISGEVLLPLQLCSQ